MRELNYDKLKSELSNPYWKQSLSPLWMKFNGAHTPHRHRANFMAIYTMYLAECDEYREGIKLLNSDELYHVCGRHSVPGKPTLMMMAGRILAVPALATRYQGFGEYLRYLGAFTPQPRCHWIEAKDQVLQYPYLRGDPKQEQLTLLEIHKMLPRNLEPDFKGEICQDIFVALLSGEVTMANLPNRIDEYKRRARKNMPEYGTRSLDEELIDGGRPGKPGLTRLDLIDSSRGMKKTGYCCVTPPRKYSNG